MALGVAAVSGGGIVASAAEAGSGDDKIEFSGAGDPITIPEGDDLRERLAGSMELLDRGNSFSGALDRPGGLPPAATPRQGLSPRLLEQFDREKNWILNRPEDLTRMQTAEGVMQIWEYDLDRALGARGVTGDSAEKRSGRSQVAPSALNPDQSDSAVVLDYRLDRGFRSRDGAQNRGWLGQGIGSQPSSTMPSPLTQNRPAAETRANSLGLSTSDLFPALSRGHVTPEIQGFLVTPNTWDPLATDFDPINLGMDSTRREINPVTSPRLSDLTGGQRLDTAASLPTVGASGSSRPTVLEEMTAKILGPSSLSPALAVPVEPPKPKPKPSTRESFGRKL